MSLDLYYFESSPPSRAVLMVSKELGLDVNIKHVNLFQGEHLSPDFVKVGLLKGLFFVSKLEHFFPAVESSTYCTGSCTRKHSRPSRITSYYDISRRQIQSWTSTVSFGSSGKSSHWPDPFLWMCDNCPCTICLLPILHGNWSNPCRRSRNLWGEIGDFRQTTRRKRVPRRITANSRRHLNEVYSLY